MSDGTTQPQGRDGTVDRRRFLGGLTAAAAIGATTAVAPATPAEARGGHRHGGRVFGPGPLPEPIVATVPTAEPGFDPPPPFDVIHWLLPGPDGSETQILKLPGFGLDVDPSLITNFKGFTAYAVIAGSAEDQDGNPYDVEFDVRVMQGRYRVDGEQHRGTFGFF